MISGQFAVLKSSTSASQIGFSDKQERVTKIFLEQAELLAKYWAGENEQI